jgi:hypothetical protein
MKLKENQSNKDSKQIKNNKKIRTTIEIKTKWEDTLNFILANAILDERRENLG